MPRQSEGAYAKERVRFRSALQVGDRFVPADIEQSDGDRVGRERASNGRIRLGLFILGRRGTQSEGCKVERSDIGESPCLIFARRHW